MTLDDVDNFIGALHKEVDASATYTTAQKKRAKDSAQFYRSIFDGTLTDIDKGYAKKPFRDEIDRLAGKLKAQQDAGVKPAFDAYDIHMANQIYDHIYRQKYSQFNKAFDSQVAPLDRDTVVAQMTVRQMGKDILDFNSVNLSKEIKDVQKYSAEMYGLQSYLEMLRARDKANVLEKGLKFIGSLMGSQSTPWFTAGSLGDLVTLGAGGAFGTVLSGFGLPAVGGMVAGIGTVVGVRKGYQKSKEVLRFLEKHMGELLQKVPAKDKMELYTHVHNVKQTYTGVFNNLEASRAQSKATTDIYTELRNIDDINAPTARNMDEAVDSPLNNPSMGKVDSPVYDMGDLNTLEEPPVTIREEKAVEDLAEEGAEAVSSKLDEAYQRLEDKKSTLDFKLQQYNTFSKEARTGIRMIRQYLNKSGDDIAGMRIKYQPNKPGESKNKAADYLEMITEEAKSAGLVQSPKFGGGSGSIEDVVDTVVMDFPTLKEINALKKEVKDLQAEFDKISSEYESL